VELTGTLKCGLCERVELTGTVKGLLVAVQIGTALFCFDVWCKLMTAPIFVCLNCEVGSRNLQRKLIFLYMS
jgi:hypothetical protein